MTGLLYGGGLSQLWAESIGVVTCFVWVFGMFYAFFKIQDAIQGIDDARSLEGVRVYKADGNPDAVTAGGRVLNVVALAPTLAEAGIGREDVIRLSVVGRDPAPNARCSARTHRDRDRLVVNRGVRLVAGLVFLESALVVVKLVGQDRYVVVAIGVERADRIGIVSPTLVARYVPHHRPRLAAVPRLVEAEKGVVAFRAGEPFARTDDVVRIRRVDADVRFRVIRHEHRGGGRIRSPIAARARPSKRFFSSA